MQHETFHAIICISYLRKGTRTGFRALATSHILCIWYASPAMPRVSVNIRFWTIELQSRKIEFSISITHSVGAQHWSAWLSKLCTETDNVKYTSAQYRPLNKIATEDCAALSNDYRLTFCKRLCSAINTLCWSALYLLEVFDLFQCFFYTN